MALPLLLSATKFLGGAISKAKSPNAENTATVDKGGKGKPGANTKSETVSITPTSPMVSSGIVSTSTTPKKVVKPISKVSFSSITNQLDSMVALTSMIDTVTQKNTEGQKRASELARRSKEKEKKKGREGKSEGGSGALGFLGGKAVEAGNKFGIFNFLTSILLGIGALALIDLTKKLSKGFDGLGNVFGGIVEGFKLFGLTIAAIAKEFPNIRTKTKNLLSKVKLGDRLRKVGTSFKSVFKRLGNKLIPEFIKNSVKVIKDALNAAKNFGRVGLEVARRALTFDTRTRVPTKTNRGLNRLLNDVGRGSGGGGGVSRGIGEGFRRLPGGSGRTDINILSGRVRTIRARYGDEAARLYQQAIGRGLNSADALSDVRKAISSGRITSQPLSGLARQGGGSQLLRGGIRQTSKRALIRFIGRGGARAVLGTLGRIPIIGPLIVGVASFLETGKLDQALFRAGGALIGGLLGSGIPILGTIIGELIGEYVGELFYILLRGGGISDVSNKLKEDIKAALTAGQAALNWAGVGFKRMYEAIPKVKLPDLGWANASVYGPTNLLLGATTGMKIQDIEMPNPFWFIDPRTTGDKFKLIGKAFLSRDPMIDGDVKESDKVELDNKVEPDNEVEPVETERVTSRSAITSGSSIVQKVPIENLQSIGAGSGDVGMTSGRGMRDDPLSGGRRMHRGVDIGTSGEKGYFVAFKLKGVVSDTGTFGSYGKTVVLTCGDKDFLFAHLAQITVQKGQKYNGEIIGEIGKTGRATHDHLHFEVSPPGTGGYGKDEDPMPFVKYLEIGRQGSDDITKSTPEVDLKPTLVKPKREDFGGGRSGGKKYAEALKAYRAEMQSQPEISPQRSPSSSVSGVESQASYEQTGGGSTVVLAAPQQSSGGGGSSGGGSVMRVGSGDVLNSYYRAQLLGFLYKQG
jgi:murein DD-endopeptidase MepM/ murein hydrolase activator NlpD